MNAGARGGDAPRDPGEAEWLRAQAGRMGVVLDARQAGALPRLLDELAQWNRAYNLTAITARAQMLTHHVLDSLAGLPWLHGQRVLDLGTGAGFPGLPLAVADPARAFTLLDGTDKKVRFVAHAARTLGLANVTAVHGRAGSWQAPQPFDTVTARAVASVGELATLAAPLLAPGGRLVLWKGQPAEAGAELRTAALGEGWRARIEPLAVPGLDAPRCLVVAERA